MTELRSICVYCGSQPGNNPRFREAAQILGSDIAANDLRLVYGGGGSGIMGELARAVQSGNGSILGIIPEFLISKERGNMGVEGNDLGEVIVTADMHERKTKLFENSDAFVALPGGIGTLEEVVEIMTWAQLGRHSRPIVFANTDGFWDPMLDLMAHMAEAGFIHTANNLKPLVVREAGDIVSEIRKAMA